MTAREVIEIKEDALSSDYYIDEALNTLRTNIQLSGRHVKSIMVTSTFSDEGKSHISLYLARKLAQIGKKVVYGSVRKWFMLSAICVSRHNL